MQDIKDIEGEFPEWRVLGSWFSGKQVAQPSGLADSTSQARKVEYAVKFTLSDSFKRSGNQTMVSSFEPNHEVTDTIQSVAKPTSKGLLIYTGITTVVSSRSVLSACQWGGCLGRLCAEAQPWSSTRGLKTPDHFHHPRQLRCLRGRSASGVTAMAVRYSTILSAHRVWQKEPYLAHLLHCTIGPLILVAIVTCIAFPTPPLTNPGIKLNREHAFSSSFRRQ